jgi:hypothetical protein
LPASFSSFSPTLYYVCDLCLLHLICYSCPDVLFPPRLVFVPDVQRVPFARATSQGTANEPILCHHIFSVVLYNPSKFHNDPRLFGNLPSALPCDLANGRRVCGSPSMSSPSQAASSEVYPTASDFLSSPSHSRSNSLGLSFAVEAPEIPSAMTVNAEGAQLSPADTIQHLFVSKTVPYPLTTFLHSFDLVCPFFSTTCTT